MGTHVGRRSPPRGTEGSVAAGAHRLCMFVRGYRRGRSKRRVGSQVKWSLRARRAWVHIPARPLTGSVTSSKN